MKKVLSLVFLIVTAITCNSQANKTDEQITLETKAWRALAEEHYELAFYLFKHSILTDSSKIDSFLGLATAVAVGQLSDSLSTLDPKYFQYAREIISEKDIDYEFGMIGNSLSKYLSKDVSDRDDLTLDRSIRELLCRLSDSKITLYNSDSILLIEGTFQNRAKSGTWKYYYNDGTLKETVHYPKPEFNIEGTVITYSGILRNSYDKNGNILNEKTTDETEEFNSKYIPEVANEVTRIINVKTY